MWKRVVVAVDFVTNDDLCRDRLFEFAELEGTRRKIRDQQEVSVAPKLLGVAGGEIANGYGSP
jgi:hypothetical protein